MPKEKTIEIDCAPGATRPGDLLPEVLQGTGIEPKEPVSKFFGNWTWDYSDLSDEIWNDANDTIKTRLTAMYHNGRVRYASW